MSDNHSKTDVPQADAAQRSAPRSSSKQGFVVLIMVALLAFMIWEQSRPIESVVAWGKDLPAAIETAQGEQKPLLISFSSPACVYCRQMEAEVFPQKDVLAEVDQFVPVKIDVSKDQEAAIRYGVDPLPTYVIADSSGKSVTRFEGYAPADRFIRFLQAGRKAAVAPSSE